MQEDKKKLDWKPAVALFTQISTWVVVPIVLALILGKMLDSRFGTRPIIFLIFAGIGFLFTCVGMYRVVKEYVKKLQSSESSSLDKGRTEEGLNQK